MCHALFCLMPSLKADSSFHLLLPALPLLYFLCQTLRLSFFQSVFKKHFCMLMCKFLIYRISTVSLMCERNCSAPEQCLSSLIYSTFAAETIYVRDKQLESGFSLVAFLKLGRQDRQIRNYNAPMNCCNTKRNTFN